MKTHCKFSEMVDVGKLKPHPKNPNTHSDAQIELLSKILAHQGFRAPIVVSRRSGFIVAGHGRLQAAIKCGAKKVPVDFQDFENEADEIAHLIADNRIAELADMDRSALRDLAEMIDDGSFDMDLTGFDQAALEELMTAAPPEDSDDLPDLSDQISARLAVVVEVDGEAQQKVVYEKMKKEGYQCRLLSL